jgi:hypothetical protein
MQVGDMLMCVKRTRFWETDKHLGRMMTFLFLDYGEPMFVLDPDVAGVKTVQKAIKRKMGGDFPMEVIDFDEVREPFVKVLTARGVGWVKKDMLCTPFELTV